MFTQHEVGNKRMKAEKHRKTLREGQQGRMGRSACGARYLRRTPQLLCSAPARADEGTNRRRLSLPACTRCMHTLSNNNKNSTRKASEPSSTACELSGSRNTQKECIVVKHRPNGITAYIWLLPASGRRAATRAQDTSGPPQCSVTPLYAAKTMAETRTVRAAARRETGLPAALGGLIFTQVDSVVRPYPFQQMEHLARSPTTQRVQ